MKRRQPSFSPERVQEQWNARTAAGESVTVQCQLVTPMYGGGVNAGEVDKAMPIRASGIRGQLRFWWRLLNGGNRPSEKLFREECKLWGGIASSGRGGPVASKVTVRIESEPADDHLTPKSKLNVPPYALILERGEDPKLLEAPYSPFKVLLGFNCHTTDEQRSQVIECLRWWASFGGVGARTRRGFGAFKASCDDADLKPVSRDEVQKLCGWIVTGRPTNDAQEAWRSAVRALQFFRQGAGVGRSTKAGSSGPGRSNWPEAATIRDLADKAKPARKDGEEVFFPRAAFGLPIVFQFKGETHLNDTLEGESDERMASPLILRPYFNGREYCPMALLLPRWQTSISMSVKLKGRDTTARSWPSDNDERQELAKKVEPMGYRGSDPLTAFMRYFDERVNGKQRQRRR